MNKNRATFSSFLANELESRDIYIMLIQIFIIYMYKQGIRIQYDDRLIVTVIL